MAQEQLPRTYEDRIKALEREVAALRKATPLKNASVGAGGIRLYGGGSMLVEDGGGIDIADGGRLNAKHPDTDGGDDAFSAGRIMSLDGEIVGYGVLVQQGDGRDLFEVRTDEASGGAMVVVRDVNEQTMIWTDPVRGGLIYPRLTFRMTPYLPANWPSTTSAAFATLWHGFARKASPQIRVQFQLAASGGTTAEARVLLDGTQVGSTASTAGTTVTASVVVDLPDPLDRSTAYLEVQGRVASGTGSAYLSVLMCEQYGGG